MRRTFFILVVLAMFTVGTIPAMAEELALGVELSTGKTADFGTVNVTEDGGGLRFEVRVNPMVAGLRADLHRLYFNLHQPTTNLTVETLDGATKPYTLRRGNRASGSGGAFFDWCVDFGSGASTKNGNGVLQHASFRIVGGVQPLAMDDIMPMSVSRAKVSVQMATHLQNASVDGQSVATVGGVFDSDPASPGDVPPPDDGGDETSPPGDGCTWVYDVFTGEPLYQVCP